tara:strand:+ start:713 stop:931 length:219 start_codon:yes stop_codon:yes gene_type:complete
MLATNIGAQLYREIEELKKEIELLHKFIEKLKGEIKQRDKILQKFTAGLPVNYIKAYNDLQVAEYSDDDEEE